MLRIPNKERSGWQSRAQEFGFSFHTMHGEKYWDESAYYQFSLKQIEEDIEAPTEEIHQMCLEVVDKVVRNDELMGLFKIPEHARDFVANSWKNNEPNLYSRLDFAYSGSGHAKLYENNADTPTSLYEAGFWQWLWLEDNVNSGKIPRSADQFNSLQDKLVFRFREMLSLTPGRKLHFSSAKGVIEDRGTVQYMEDCAKEAGIDTSYVAIEDIGATVNGDFTDLNDDVITWMFKLYPWEFMFNEEYAPLLGRSDIRWIEPAWKSILSNKALLPMLWKMFPNHPNLLPSFFEHELKNAGGFGQLIKKPIFSREGANISVLENGRTTHSTPGIYGDEGYIYQAAKFLPKFGDNHTLIGSWLVDDKAAGISIREDKSRITQDMSRFLPHIIQN